MNSDFRSIFLGAFAGVQLGLFIFNLGMFVLTHDVAHLVALPINLLGFVVCYPTAKI
jgi:hypothetical protein